MALLRFVTHRLQSGGAGSGVQVQLAERELDEIGPGASLFEQVRATFQRSASKKYGRFDPDAEVQAVRGWFNDYNEQRSSFVSLTSQITKLFSDMLASASDGFDFHLMFAEEEFLQRRRFYVFCIEHTSSMAIDSDLHIAQVRYLDTSRISLAFRLDVDDWLQDLSPKYLVMLAGRGNKFFAECFVQLAGFAEGVDLPKQTTEFLDIVEKYTEQVPFERQDEYKAKIVDYCLQQDSSGDAVVLEQISEQLDPENPTDFQRFVNERQTEEDNELHLHRSSLKRYARFSGRDKDISLSFSSRLFGDNVVYEPQVENLVIKRIPKSLRMQIKKFRDAE